MSLGGFVSGASTLALARVLTFAPIIASLASALALTRILAFAGVRAFGGVSESADGSSSLTLDAGCVRLHCKRSAQ
jgi:hypothetical protein